MNEDAEAVRAMNLGALEKFNAYKELIELEYDQYLEVMTDGEPKRPEATG